MICKGKGIKFQSDKQLPSYAKAQKLNTQPLNANSEQLSNNLDLDDVQQKNLERDHSDYQELSDDKRMMMDKLDHKLSMDLKREIVFEESELKSFPVLAAQGGLIDMRVSRQIDRNLDRVSKNINKQYRLTEARTIELVNNKHGLPI